MSNQIKPEDVIKRLGIEGLCKSADDYFKNISNPIPLMNKPFHSITEGPYLLCKMGQLLSGLRLGKGMTVLDFGAGSCWLSRFLNELSCATISTDPSPTALEIGQKLFKQFPPINASIKNPQFFPFNGKKIPLENNSVDRIICFDAFHHVPNPQDILKEFFRILKPGGIAGFSEVGPHHSQSPQSQMEMRNYNVLENDIELEHIKEISKKIGFSNIYCKLFSHPDLEINLPDYLKMVRKKKIPKSVKDHVTHSMTEFPIFFLVKGNYIPDSRNPNNLKHQISLNQREIKIKAGEKFSLTATIENNGNAIWLYKNIKDIGVVNLGVHLFSKENKIIDYDFLRFNLGKNILPGESLQKEIQISMETPGTFRLMFDLVSEQVCWFEQNNSKPISIALEVQ